ncbi:hypothetical protein RIR_jg35013.t1 [Rhizophagus irregularis DAOM 181602=DAOM 197198]|nr:hypothetical protein RIR_jg35013.t1 [Rhizophagus irregularis DAOM 181602=DAOM 197198]
MMIDFIIRFWGNYPWLEAKETYPRYMLLLQGMTDLIINSGSGLASKLDRILSVKMLDPALYVPSMLSSSPCSNLHNGHNFSSDRS